MKKAVTAIIVLAVQFNECLGQSPQNLSAHAPVIHPGCLSPVGSVHPPQDQLVLDFDPRLCQHLKGGMSLREFEPGGHLTLFGPLPDQLGPPAPAQHEPERIEQDRLARPGLAGEDARLVAGFVLHRLQLHQLVQRIVKAYEANENTG